MLEGKPHLASLILCLLVLSFLRHYLSSFSLPDRTHDDFLVFLFLLFSPFWEVICSSSFSVWRFYNIRVDRVTEYWFMKNINKKSYFPSSFSFYWFMISLFSFFFSFIFHGFYPFTLRLFSFHSYTLPPSLIHFLGYFSLR